MICNPASCHLILLLRRKSHHGRVSLGGLTSGLTDGQRRVSSCVRTKVLESARWRHLSLSQLSDMTRRGVKINTESLDSGQSVKEGQEAHCCHSPGCLLQGGVVRLEGSRDAKPREGLSSCCLLFRARSLKRLPRRSARDCCYSGWCLW